jgi:hypothetical protein
MLDQSLWKFLTRYCEDHPAENDDMLAEFPRASQSMADLEAVCRGDQINGPFDSALSSIRRLMQCYVFKKHEMAEPTFNFAIKLDRRFLRFIEEGVPKALLGMCYRYALVMQVDQCGRTLRHTLKA